MKTPKQIVEFQKAVEAACAPKPATTGYRTGGIGASLVYFPIPVALLSPGAIQEEFAKLGRNDPLWQALMVLLDQRKANAMQAAAQRDENAPGRLEELLDLQRELAGLRNAPETVRRPKVTPS